MSLHQTEAKKTAQKAAPIALNFGFVSFMYLQHDRTRKRHWRHKPQKERDENKGSTFPDSPLFHHAQELSAFLGIFGCLPASSFCCVTRSSLWLHRVKPLNREAIASGKILAVQSQKNDRLVEAHPRVAFPLTQDVPNSCPNLKEPYFTSTLTVPLNSRREGKGK